MTGHAGLIKLRSRELTLRLLDKSKIKKDRRKWVLINTISATTHCGYCRFVLQLVKKKKIFRRIYHDGPGFSKKMILPAQDNPFFCNIGSLIMMGN